MKMKKKMKKMMKTILILIKIKILKIKEINLMIILMRKKMI